MRLAVLATCLAAMLVVAPPASAHGGKTPPVATDYRAVVTYVPRGLRASVVDGDRRLWLRVPGDATVIVVGAFGAPSVALGAGDYSWHENRLRTLVADAPRGSRALGVWSVPLLVDGRRARLGGELFRVAPPTRLWLAPILLVTLLLLIGARRRGTAVPVAAALLALGAAALALVGRDLYGRPGIGTGAWIRAAVAAAVVVATGWAVARRDWRVVGLLVAGAIAVYAGLVLHPVLTHGLVLSALPASLERAATVVAVGAGIASAALGFRADD